MGAGQPVPQPKDVGPNQVWTFERNHGNWNEPQYRTPALGHGVSGSVASDAPGDWKFERNHGPFKERPLQVPCYYHSLRDEPLKANLLEIPVDVSPSLTEMDIQLIQQTWERASRLGTENVGKVVFMQIFKIAPGAIQLFPFKDDTPDSLYAVGSRLNAHASKVVATLATAVSLLRDLDTLVPVLVELGLRHVGYGVMPEHYDVVAEAVLAALNIALAERNTPAVVNAWTKVLKVVKTVMIPKQGAALDNNSVTNSVKSNNQKKKLHQILFRR